MPKPLHSPWGPVHEARELAPGIWDVSTAGHGGIKLDPKLNQRIPEYMRRSGGWYEEDVDWSHVATVFPEFFDEKTRRLAERIFLEWRPDMYEQFYKVKLEEGASQTRDLAVLMERHKNNLIARTAFGDWHPQVPEGMVVVYATLGGKGGAAAEADPESGYFLVPGDEYQRKSWAFFVVYPAKHPQIEDFDPYAR